MTVPSSSWGRGCPRGHLLTRLQDAEWGPAFVKVGTYLPYPVRVCLNGHHWAQQQLRRAGLAFETLDNGFRWCADPTRLQAVCDALGPTDVEERPALRRVIMHVIDGDQRRAVPLAEFGQ